MVKMMDSVYVRGVHLVKCELSERKLSLASELCSNCVTCCFVRRICLHKHSFEW